MAITGEEFTMTGEYFNMLTGEAIASPVNMLKYALPREVSQSLHHVLANTAAAAR